MRLDEFIGMSMLPEMQVESMYFKPNIPVDKLANAIRAYAQGVGISAVTVLVDETFLGDAKEGLLITNEKIYLSKRFGRRVIDLALVNDVSIEAGHLIVNELSVAKLNNPEVLPCRALGAKLNDFVIATRNLENARSIPTIENFTKAEIDSFLAGFCEPRYFDSAPARVRKPGVTTAGYVLPEKLTEEQRKLVRFRGWFAPNEDTLCVSWLDSHNKHDYFFCVTNCGIRTVGPNGSVLFLPHSQLRDLTVKEEFQDGRYVGVRLSNGKEIIVSVKNEFFRPYALELFSGLITRLGRTGFAITAADTVPILRPTIPKYSLRNSGVAREPNEVVDNILGAAFAATEYKFFEDDDLESRKVGNLLLNVFRNVYTLAMHLETRRKLWPAGSPPADDMMAIYMVLITCLYTHGLQSLPMEFKSGFGDAWIAMLSIPQLLRESIEEVCDELGIEFNVDEEFIWIFQFMTSDMANVNEKNKEYFGRVLLKAGVDRPSEIAVNIFERAGVPAKIVRGLMKQAESISENWLQHVMSELMSGRLG